MCFALPSRWSLLFVCCAIDRGHVCIDLLSLRVLRMHQHACALGSEHEHAHVAALQERLQGGWRRGGRQEAAGRRE